MYSASPAGDRPSSSRGRSPHSRSRKGQRKSGAIQRKLCGPLPLSESGQRLAKLFPNGWDWIYADAPSNGSAIQWETIKKFPLSPIELWTLHQDPSCVIGMRPDSSTRWGIIDIDATSKYHPSQDPTAITLILDALEDIGLCRTLINQSSHSGVSISMCLYQSRPAALEWLSRSNTPSKLQASSCVQDSARHSRTPSAMYPKAKASVSITASACRCSLRPDSSL